LICVFDSGVWISAFQFGGTPLTALRTAYRQHRIATGDKILQEIRRILRQKFGWSPDRIEGALNDYLDDVLYVQIPGVVKGVCRDPNDDMVFECAVMTGAEVVVSGDKDLLAVGTYEGIRVLTPREFLNEFAVPR
jgi:putative PIN family toxin of toxin-antitoxin system